MNSVPSAAATPVMPHAAEPQNKPRNGARIGLIIGAVALIGAILLLVINGNIPLFGPKKQVVSAQTAVTAVERYLGAIASNDAATALELVDASAEQPLMSEAALKRSNELAQLTDIVVSINSAEEYREEGATQVDTSYRLGDTQVVRQYQVSAKRSGQLLTGCSSFR